MLNKTYQQNNNLIIQLGDKFDAETVKCMKNDIETYSKLATNIVFDLEQVGYIDSSGIGAIVFLYKRMVTKGCSVAVTGLTKQPLELFQMLFLDKTINCYPSLSTYMASAADIQVAS